MDKSRDFNLFIVKGFVIEEPVLTATPNGKEFYNFKIGTKIAEDVVNYYNCEAWDKSLFNGISFFKKGTKILIQGAMKISTYEKEGTKRNAYKIVVDKFSFLGIENDVVDENGKQTHIEKPESAKAKYWRERKEKETLISPKDVAINQEKVKEAEPKYVDVSQKFANIDIDDDIPF